jgi:hypothetical protein
MGTARGQHEAGVPQRMEQVLQVLDRQVLPLGEHCQRHGTILTALGQL